MVYTVPVTAKTYPAREWKLVQSDGSFHTQEQSFLSEQAKKSRTFVFERGDVVDITYDVAARSGQYVQKGTPLLRFSSMMHRLDVQRAENQKTIQQSRYKADSAPDRVPAIRLAEEDIILAQANVTFQEKNNARMETLHAEGVISTFELDQQINLLSVAKQELALAERRLQEVKFGVKSQDLDVFSAIVATAESELEVLSGRSDSYSVDAPFDGLVKMNPEAGVIVQLSDTTLKSIVFPIELSELEHINASSRLSVAGSNTVGRSFEIGDAVGQVNGHQVRLGSILSTDPTRSMGGFSEYVIRCDTVRLGEYLKRKLF